MFNLKKVGLKISELRKSKNMTQMELADLMNISFQAVSNWERGSSMPDISKLPELASLFGVTIDELISERSALIDSVASGEIDEYIENNNVTVQELSDAAPVLKPQQVDLVFERAKVNSLREVADILPYISSDVINQLARKAVAAGNLADLGEIAPFVSCDFINEIARKLIAEGKAIGEIAPYVAPSIISELAEASYLKSGLSSFDDIAPYIRKEQLQKIAEEEYQNFGLQHFEVIAPYLDKAYLNELAKKTIHEKGIKAIGPIAPYIDKSMLSEYVREKFL